MEAARLAVVKGTAIAIQKVEKVKQVVDVVEVLKIVIKTVRFFFI